MGEPIRVLHFADIHIGMENYGRSDEKTGLSSRVLDFLRRFDEMIQFARENDVDLTVFAGDAFKTRNPNPTFQREFAYRIADLADLAPIILLEGNHDLQPNARRASTIEIYDVLSVKNVILANEIELHHIQTKRGDVAVGTIPYPMRSLLLQGVSTAGFTIAEIDQMMQDVLVERIEQLATDADQMDMPRLLTGHFTVSGALLGSERQIMVGRDISLSLSTLADPRWDYVALGHIHKHQNLTHHRQDAPPVVYSGSMERIDFGEEGDPKGFCWVGLQRENTIWDFQPLPARPFVTLRADLRQSANPTQNVIDLIRQHNLQEAVVRVQLQLSVETESRFNEQAIQRELRNRGAFFIAAVRKEVDSPARMRLDASPESLTESELLERYLISKHIPAERRAQLLELAQPIFHNRLLGG
ncbi:MAG: metallophosphoesterase family protein [Phototrophicaceae bacterium]